MGAYFTKINGEKAKLMTHPDITADLGALMPKLRGKMRANVPLRDITWVRVGGPAQVLFYPVDEKDLTYFLNHL